MKTYLKNTVLLVIIAIVSMIQMNTLSAQNSSTITVRDHRPKANTTAFIRDHRTNSTVNQVLFFDEADAVFGKRTTIPSQPASVKFTSNVPVIRLSHPSNFGNSFSCKMSSGSTLYGYVKNGKIQQLNLKNSSQAYPIKENVGNTAKKTDTCLSCKQVCVQEFNDLGHPVGAPDCEFVCTPVKCDDKRKNGVLVGGKFKQ